MTKILIVEDDVAIAQLIEKFLLHESYTVKVLYSGDDVIEQTKKWQPDLVVLDIMLPGKSGIICCQEIRMFSELPIVMLTARVEEMDRIIGLKAGADDYICKPFSAMELVLRIQSILKRTEKQLNLAVDGARFYLNEHTFIVSYQQNEVELTHLEFLLFHLLYNKPGRVYSRQEIIDLAYPDRPDIFDRTIDSHVKNIRKKIKSLNINVTVIDSVYGAGYRYLALVE